MDRIHWQSSGKDRCSKSQAAIGTVGPMQPALPGSFWVSADEKRCLVFQPRHFVLQALSEGRKEHTSQNNTAAALLTGMSVRTVAAVLSVIRRRGGAARCPIVASVVVEPARGLQAFRSCFGIASATSRCGCLLTAKHVRVLICWWREGRSAGACSCGAPVLPGTRLALVGALPSGRRVCWIPQWQGLALAGLQQVRRVWTCCNGCSRHSCRL